MIRRFLKVELFGVCASLIEKLTSHALDADRMGRNDGRQTYHHHQLGLL